MNSFKDLEVWKRSIELVKVIYKLTEDFPDTEKFGLVSQMRRCSVSIPSNVAEGRRRGSKSDFKRFVQIAYGSGGELETQLIITRELELGDKSLQQQALDLLDEVMRMLNGLLRSLS